MAVEHSSQISKLSLVTWEVDATTGEWLIIRIHLYIWKYCRPWSNDSTTGFFTDLELCGCKKCILWPLLVILPGFCDSLFVISLSWFEPIISTSGSTFTDVVMSSCPRSEILHFPISIFLSPPLSVVSFSLSCKSPSRGCKNCPMFGVGLNPDFQKKEKKRKEMLAKAEMKKKMENQNKRAELWDDFSQVLLYHVIELNRSLWSWQTSKRSMGLQVGSQKVCQIT